MVQAMRGIVTDCVDHYALCYKVFCVETQSIVAWDHRLRDETNNFMANFMDLTVSECIIIVSISSFITKALENFYSAQKLQNVSKNQIAYICLHS